MPKHGGELDQRQIAALIKRIRWLDSIIPHTFLLLALALLAGCDMPKPMPRKEVIAACKECEDAGMRAEVMRNMDGIVLDVQCFPVDQSKKEAK